MFLSICSELLIREVIFSFVVNKILIFNLIILCNLLSRYARKALRGASKNDASARIDELVSSKRSDIQLGLDCIARGKDVDLDDLDLGEEYKHFSGLSLGTQVC